MIIGQDFSWKNKFTTKRLKFPRKSFLGWQFLIGISNSLSVPSSKAESDCWLHVLFSKDVKIQGYFSEPKMNSRAKEF